MTDEEALKEIDRQEKRFAAAKCGRGLRLAKSAREYYETMVALQREAAESEAGCAAAKRKIDELVAAVAKAEVEARAKMAEAKKLRSRIFQQRRLVKDGESLKNQVHLARVRLEEKLQKLAYLPAEQSDGEGA